jgi:16S rRNA (guanine(1405)-N(7))-methyltransferase
VTSEIVERVRRSSRYRDVDAGLVRRLAEEELARARNPDDAVKRVKRRLHQAVGAFRGARRVDPIAAAWDGDLGDPGLRAACADAMRGHASTRERLPHLDRFYAGIWALTGTPQRLADLGCGLNPLALAWMEVGDAELITIDVDERPLATVRDFLELVGQPHEVERRDLVTSPPAIEADVTLLLKLVTTLDRQDPDAAGRLVGSLRSRHAVVSFTTRSLGGRARGMERTYRHRLDRLASEVGRISRVEEASIPNELVFVLTLEPPRG